MLATLIPGLITSLSVLFMKTRLKRDRLLAVLPVSRHDVTYGNLLIPAAVWISLVVVFWLIPETAGFVDVDTTIFPVMFYLNGCFFIMNALYLISVDLKYVINNNKILFNFSIGELVTVISTSGMILLWLIVFGIPYGFVFGIFESFRLIIQPIVLSSSGVILINLLGIILSYLCVKIFINRKSFLE